MIYNHDRPLSDFDEPLALIRKEGFNPIAVTQLLFEDVFVYETDEEAKQAYHVLETSYPISGKTTQIGEVVAWWYGRIAFKKTVKDYEAKYDNKQKVRIYWLNSEDQKCKN